MAPKGESPAGSGRVLVVDDDPDFAEGLDVVLAPEGYEVSVAYDSDTAVRALDDFPADVALIDIRLRNNNGINLIARLREQRPNISCVMMTAYASTDSAIKALHEGANEYLRKPIHSGDLLATLERRFAYLRLDTERQAAEESLRESQARYRSLIDNSPSAHDLKDLDGCYRLVNRRFEKWYGVPAPDLIGRTGDEVFSKKAADEDADHDRDVIEQRQTSEREVDVYVYDGTVRRVIVTKYPVFDAGGRIIGVGSINTDVTVRKETEERLGQVQKMEAVGKLTGGIAHDFNNLLAVIMGYAELMTDKVQDNGELSDYIMRMTRAAAKGTELTKRLLAFSRRQPLHPRIIDLSALLTDMNEILRRTLGADITLEIFVAEDVALTLADSVQVETAVLNLALNARDAMPQGGSLSIKVTNAAPHETLPSVERALDSRSFVALEVSDTGTGMSPAILDRALEPFFTTKPVGEGTGLGLSMVYGFAKQSEGHITIESEEGQGTTVRLYLPQAEAGCRPDLPEMRGVEPSGGDEVVLVVEDDPDVRSLAVLILEGLGYDVFSARNGKEALAKMADLPRIDLLLSDVVLPGGISGPEVAEVIRRLRPDTKVLLMSGYPARTIYDRHTLPEDVELLDKPFHKRDLAEKVRATLDR